MLYCEPGHLESGVRTCVYRAYVIADQIMSNSLLTWSFDDTINNHEYMCGLNYVVVVLLLLKCVCLLTGPESQKQHYIIPITINDK